MWVGPNVRFIFFYLYPVYFYLYIVIYLFITLVTAPHIRPRKEDLIWKELENPHFGRHFRIHTKHGQHSLIVNWSDQTLTEFNLKVSKNRRTNAFQHAIHAALYNLLDSSRENNSCFLYFAVDFRLYLFSFEAVIKANPFLFWLWTRLFFKRIKSSQVKSIFKISKTKA